MTLVVVVIAALVLEYLRVSYKHYMEIFNGYPHVNGIGSGSYS